MRRISTICRRRRSRARSAAALWTREQTNALVLHHDTLRTVACCLFPISYFLFPETGNRKQQQATGNGPEKPGCGHARFDLTCGSIEIVSSERGIRVLAILLLLALLLLFVFGLFLLLLLLVEVHRRQRARLEQL